MDEKIQWKFILDTIKSGKCVLILGPDLTSQNGKSLYKLLLENLDVEKNPDILSYYEKDDLFLFKKSFNKTKTFYNIKDFYEKEYNDNIFQKIALLPLSLIISITPDSILSKTFKTLKIEHNFNFYHKKQNSKEVETPKKDYPLIYNLFGTLEDEESLILTHDDLLDFMYATMGNNNFPLRLRETLNNTDNFIFLGFSFEKWYLQIILRLLNPNKEKFKFALDKLNEPKIHSFFMSNYNLEFSNLDSENFINQLFDLCKEQNILRNLEHSSLSFSEQIINLVEKNEIETALNKLKSFFEDKDADNFNITIGLMAKNNKLKSNILKGILDANEIKLQTSTILNSVLEINNEVKNFEK